jgi:hypothetical protein
MPGEPNSGQSRAEREMAELATIMGLNRPFTPQESQKIMDFTMSPNFMDIMMQNFPGGEESMQTQEGKRKYAELIKNATGVGQAPAPQMPPAVPPQPIIPAARSSGAPANVNRYPDIPVSYPDNPIQMQNNANPFGGLPMDVASVMEVGASRLNPFMRMVNPANFPLTGDPVVNRRKMLAATNNPNIVPAVSGGQYQIPGFDNNKNLIPTTESRLAKAVKICEAVTSDDCNAFNNPEFAKSCIISHVPGTNTKGAKQMGGFVLFEEERNAQLEGIRNGSVANMQPLIGSIPIAAEGKSQYVSYDQQSCKAMKETKDCESGAAFGASPNCSKCTDGRGNFYRIAPDAEKMGPSLILAGNGEFAVLDDKGAPIKSGQLSNAPVSVELPPDAEGRNFTISVTGTEVAGFLEGPTLNGRTRVDIVYLITADTLGNSAKPRLRGRMVVNEEPLSKIVPFQGKNGMRLITYVPFTFLGANEPTARLCPTAPFNRFEKSSTLLQNDVCYLPNSSAPGKQSKECLQDRWERAGCVLGGTAAPTNDQKANDLRFVNGQPQSLFDITGRVMDLSIMAETGKDMNGRSLDQDPATSVANWNKVSMQCLNKPISTPCDGVPVNGPVSLACAQFLYNDNSSYSQKDIDKLTSARVGNDAVRCLPAGSAYPTSEDSPAFKTILTKGGRQGVKDYYNEIHTNANNNRLTDGQRADAVKSCYGINFAPDSRTTEDFQNPGFRPLEGSMRARIQEGYASVSGTTTLNPGIGEEVSYRGVGRNNFLAGPKNARFVDNDNFRSDGTFIKRNPVCGSPGYVSLVSDQNKDLFLTNVNGKVIPFDITKTEFQAATQNNACWREVKGQCADPSAVRLESKMYPGQFMISRGKDIFLDSATQSGDDKGACWMPTTPLTNKSFTPAPEPGAMSDFEVRRAWNLHDDNRSWGDNPSYETNPTKTATWEECAKRALDFVDWRGNPANGFVWAPPERAQDQFNCRTKIGGYFQQKQDPNWWPLISGKLKEEPK